MPEPRSLPPSTAAVRVGDQVRLQGRESHWWWTVRAVSEHFAVCVHQVSFRPRGTFCYTVLDWTNGRRGPCNLIGWGFGDGSYSREHCDEMLGAFGRHLTLDERLAAAGGSLAIDETNYTLEVSHRNNVPLEVLDVRSLVGVTS